jgi:uncharacterized membrane protein
MEFLQTLFSRDGWELFGRFHVLTVHLPIGLLLAAAFIELYGIVRRRPCPSPAAQACLGIGAATAIASSVMGWAHADYFMPARSQVDTLFYHRWIGIAAAVVAVITLGLYYVAEKRRGTGAVRVYQLSTLVTAFLITVAGHFGGTLTHGPDYFTIRHESPVVFQTLPATRPASIPASIPAATRHGVLTYNDVQPIFADRCYNCHSQKEQKADLRTDSLQALLTGGESGPAIVPNDLENSLLLQRVKGLGEDQRMPPKGPPLTPAQIHMIEQWIQAGAK